MTSVASVASLSLATHIQQHSSLFHLQSASFSTPPPSQAVLRRTLRASAGRRELCYRELRLIQSKVRAGGIFHKSSTCLLNQFTASIIPEGH